MCAPIVDKTIFKLNEKKVRNLKKKKNFVSKKNSDSQHKHKSN